MPVFTEDTAARRASTEQASRDGTLFRAFFQGPVPANTTYYFTIDIPLDVKLVGFSRFVEVEEGSIRASFGEGTGYGATSASYTGHNFKIAGGPLPKATMRRVTLPENLEIHTPNKLISAPVGGPVRLPSSQTDIGAQVTLDSDHLPFFTITNISTTAARDCSLLLAWQELNKVSE